MTFTEAIAHPTAPLGYLAKVFPSGVDKKTVDGEQLVRLCNYTDIYYRDRITSDMDFMEATATEAEVARFTLRSGDVVITKDSETADDIAIPALVTEDLGGVVLGYHNALIRPDTSKLDPRFLFWALMGRQSAGYFETKARGVTRVGLRADDMAALPVPMPPMQVQRRVADMLDAETARIDALITKNQTVLGNLDQRIVSLRAELLWPTAARQTWTGSPLDAPTSAVPSATKVQYVVPVRVAGGTPPTGTDAYWSEDPDALPWFGVGDFGHGQETGAPSRRVTDAGVTAAALKVMRRGDLLLAMYGATSGKAGVLSEPGTTNQAVMAMRSDPRVLRQDYLIEWFNFARPYAYEKAESRSSTQPNLNAGQIEQFSIRCPSLAEQDAATKALAHFRETAGALRQRVERQIDLLRTRRQSLITAAVTGQIIV